MDGEEFCWPPSAAGVGVQQQPLAPLWCDPFLLDQQQQQCTPLASPSSAPLAAAQPQQQQPTFFPQQTTQPPPQQMAQQQHRGPSVQHGWHSHCHPPASYTATARNGELAQQQPFGADRQQQHRPNTDGMRNPSSVAAAGGANQQQQPAAVAGPSTPLPCASNGGHQADQQQRQRSMAAYQKVHQWQQFGTGQVPLMRDSGVQSMSHSTANSSLMSVHPVSCLSGVSSLPEEYPGSALHEHPYFQHIPSGIRHEEPEKMRQVLPDLVPLINDESEEVAMRALTILSSISKKDKELGLGRMLEGANQQQAPVIGERRVVEELLRTLSTHRKNKKVICYALRTLHFISDNEPSGRDLFVRTLDAHGTGCLEELVHCIGIQEHSCFKYAFLILHNLMSDPRIGRKVVAYMCELRMLTQVLGWLQLDRNEKFLNIVTDIVHMLVGRNSEQMAYFLGLDGHQLLIKVAAQAQQETLLYRTVKLLGKIVHLDPQKMVASGVLEALQRHLAHPSQRLLRQLLDCIRAVSHVPSAGHNIQPLLQKLMQLLGTNDLRLKESCADILANLSANNARNKEFLVHGGAVHCLFQLLHELDALDGALGPSQQRDGIQETALVLLKSLCTGNPLAQAAKRQILATEQHKRLLLERLRQQQRQHLPLLRRILLLLHHLAQEPQDLPALAFSLVFAPPFPQFPDAPLIRHREEQHCSFASQTVNLLQQMVNSMPDSAELCQRCLDILRAMCQNEALAKEVLSELWARRLPVQQGQPRLTLPQLLLRYYVQLAPAAIALMAELGGRLPEAVQLFQRDPGTLDCLGRWAATDTQTAQLAARTAQLLRSNGTGGAGAGVDFSPMAEGKAIGGERQTMMGGQQATNNGLSSSYTPSSWDGGEELSALNNSPAQQMDFSPANCNLQHQNGFQTDHHHRQQHNQHEHEQHQQHNQHEHGHHQQHNQHEHEHHQLHQLAGEQLAPFAPFPDFQPDSLSSFLGPGDDFSSFAASALCPSSSPSWAHQLP